MNLPRIISLLKQILSKDFLLKNRGLSVGVFFVLSIYTFKGITNNNDLRLEGDGMEYVLMTEAFYNHHSPDIRSEDIETFRKKAEKVIYRKDESKVADYDRLLRILADTSTAVGTDLGGFSLGENRKCYSIHFYTYSLFMTPVVWAFKPFNIHPIKVFWYANGIFLLTVVFIILFTNKNREILNILVSLLFIFSVFQWYSVWAHPEVFICSLMFIGLWVFTFNEKHYWALVCTCIAATQFQPFALIPVLLALQIFRKEKYQWLILLKLLCVLSIVILPSLFYFTNFGVTNMVKNLGYLDTKYITFNRVFGFFFDINQGLIIAFPLLFITYLVMWLLSIYQLLRRRNEEQLNFTHFIFPVIILIVVISASMGNWNGGGSITHRYVNYAAALLLFHFAYLLFTYKSRKSITFFVVMVAVVQIGMIDYFGGFQANGWAYVVHKEWPKYILDHYPEKYNPDPRIFMVRTANARSDDYFGKGVVYVDDEIHFKKAIVHCDSLAKSIVGNLSKQQIEFLTKDKYNQYGWVYINENAVKQYLSGPEYQKFDAEVKIQYFIDKLRDDENTMQNFRKTEIEKGILLNDLLRQESIELAKSNRK